jgi:hypothetical protein
MLGFGHARQFRISRACGRFDNRIAFVSPDRYRGTERTREVCMQIGSATFVISETNYGNGGKHISLDRSMLGVRARVHDSTRRSPKENALPGMRDCDHAAGQAKLE